MKCFQCQHDNPAGARFCSQCGIRFASDAAAPKFADPDSYTPRHLAERILTSRVSLEGERKQITVLFADLKGSMELLAERDPEEARRLLDPVLERMMEAVHRYEGTVNQVMGDGIMALFGAPLAHEDHAIRACYAAMRMQEAVKAYASEVGPSAQIAIRVGLNSGEVVVRSIGSDLRMDYTAVGQTTHLAARMEQAATAGSILITRDTLRLVEAFVEVRALGPVAVKGLASPVDVFEVIRASAVRRRLDASALRGLTRFVGRRPELERLASALDGARRGEGQAIAIVGEAGVGKSRLFYEFLHSQRIAGCLIRESSSVSYGKATPFAPLIELIKACSGIEPRDDADKVREKVASRLRTLDALLEPLLPALLALLDIPVDDLKWQTLDPRQRRSRTLDACRRLLRRESQILPLILVFEDLHWIDAETQAFLDLFMENLPSARVLLLVNYRPEYRHRWESKTCFTELRADPLAPEGAVALLDALLGTDATLVAFKQLLIQKTEGNPFFLEESVRALVETRALAGAPGQHCLEKAVQVIEVPSTVQAILAARIDRLAPGNKQLLQLAAVIGYEVPFRLLQALAGQSEENLRVSLSELRRGEFLYEAGLFPEQEYRFRHALTHEVAYRSLLQRKRCALHAQVVCAIEEVHAKQLAEHVEVLARHSVRGESWEKAVDYLRQAGAAVFARGSLAHCVERYEQAVGITERLPTNADNLRRSVDIRIRLGSALYPLGQFAHAVRVLEKAESLARELGDARRHGQIANAMVAMLAFTGRYREGLKQAKRALAIAESQADARLGTWAMHVCSFNHGALGEYVAAIENLRPHTDGSAVEMAMLTPDPIGGSMLVTASCWRALSHAFLGEFREATRIADLARQSADRMGVPIARTCAGVYATFVLQLRGEMEQSIAICERAHQESKKEKLGFWISVSSIVFGLALADLGRADEGLPLIQQGLAMNERMETKLARSWYRTMHARALISARRLSEARAEAEAALELARSLEERGFEAIALEVLGNAAAARERPDRDQTERYFVRGLELADRLGMRPTSANCHLGLGRMLRNSGHDLEARRHLEAATAMYREMDLPRHLARAEAEFALLPS